MASNSFGNIFRWTTWGESHGHAIGVVIDGCPAGIEISAQEINAELRLRSPGRNPHTSPRKESDQAQILSGIFEGKTTGAPISILIPNEDSNSKHYEPLKDLLRPGHANFTYLEKYGTYDYRGGGRASARETAARVAAGAIAKKFLSSFNIQIAAYIKQIGSVVGECKHEDLGELRHLTYQNNLHCPDELAAERMLILLEAAKSEGDSLGGIVEFIAVNLPRLGDPIYEKIEAKLAYAMMSLPATKGFEIGSGFGCVSLKGSEHNDLFIKNVQGEIQTSTNFSGGTLGGISTGMPLIGRVAFKPTSSIKKTQPTLNLMGEPLLFQLPEGSRHDPCVAIRAVVVVEALVALVLADALLLNRCAKL